MGKAEVHKMKNLIVIILIGILSYGLVFGYGSSITTKDAVITFDHTSNCDSARAVFCYPDTSNRYDSVKLSPCLLSDSSLLSGVVDLDSTGGHLVLIRYYEEGAGAISGQLIGIWLNYDDTLSMKTMMDSNMATSSEYAKTIIDSLNLDSLYWKTLSDSVAAHASGAGQMFTIWIDSFLNYAIPDSLYADAAAADSAKIGFILKYTHAYLRDSLSAAPTNFSYLKISDSGAVTPVDTFEGGDSSLRLADSTRFKAEDVNVASVDNGALNLETDVTGVLEDANVATLTTAALTVAMVSSGAISNASFVANAINAAALNADAVTEIEAAVYANRADYGSTGSDTTAIRVMMQKERIARLSAADTTLRLQINSAGYLYIDVETSTGDTVAVMSDSTIYQGSASGLTDSAIYAYFIDGSREDQFKDGSSGTGAYPCSLYVFDSDDSATAIQGVFVRGMNDAQSATLGVDLTDGNGLAVLSLDAAQHKIWMYKAGITAANPDSVTVTSPSLTDTLYVAVFSPSIPASPDLCNVYGNVVTIENEGVENLIVTLELVGKNFMTLDSQYIISPFARADTTDADGYFEIPAYPTAGLLPSGSYYMATIRKSAGAQVVKSKRIQVPDQANWRLAWSFGD
jgi:hypothetical protein